MSARPTMAALLEKMPPDYTLATCPEKPSEDTIKVRPVVQQKPEDITSKMPADWRQQLLRHIEAKRLDRVCPRNEDPCKRTMAKYTQTQSTQRPSLSVSVSVFVVRLAACVSTSHCRCVSLTCCTLSWICALKITFPEISENKGKVTETMPVDCLSRSLLPNLRTTTKLL